MSFSTAGTDGPRLDGAALARLDLGHNVWGSLPSAADARRAAELFRGAGWRVRLSSRTEYEVECTFAELEILPVRPVTFAGFVDPDRVGVLLAALEGMGLSFEVEFTDAEGRDHLHRSNGHPH
ncbi:hypothetical protein AB0E96_38405 [Kitasatospora sp. NPDC036755]|uniref:hypothetical protein n=1 Tax=Kitasatospora sp. NPDC036755 TaxID=3154600 RepID=UPI00340D458B